MKIKAWVMAAFIFLPLTVHAADLERVDLDGNEAPAPMEILADRDELIYLVKYVTTPLLELFPSKKQPSKGTVIVAPGGGYRSLAVTHEGYNVAMKLNELGFDAAVLIYHINPDESAVKNYHLNVAKEEREATRDIALGNAQKALRLLRARGKEWGLNTQRVGIIGFSAGGHLAARLAHSVANEKPLDFVALVYPGSLSENGEIPEDVKPTRAPLFIYIAADDFNFKKCEDYMTFCKSSGISFDSHIPTRGGHGFGIRQKIAKEVMDLPEKLEQFLNQVVQ